MYQFKPDKTFMSDYKNLITISAIQGIANRDKPTLYISYETSQYPYRYTDQEWLKNFKSDGFIFEEITDFKSLLEKFSDYFKKIIIVNDRIKDKSSGGAADANFAAMISSITGYLPVSNENLRLVMEVAELEVVDNFMIGDLKLGGDITSSLIDLNLNEPSDIYNLAYEKLLSHGFLNKNSIMSMTTPSMDYAIQNKMMYISLYQNSSQKDKKLLEKIYRHMRESVDGWSLYGWVEEESTGMQLIAKNGGVIRCIADGNLSFLSGIKGPCKLKQKCSFENNYDENKIYLTFMASENDTIKVVQSFQHGAWLDSNRGRISINWGMPAYVLKDFPYVAGYYYKTATSQDYFFCGAASAAGFTFINSEMPLKSIDYYAKFAKKYMTATDQKYLDFYTDYLNENEYEPDVISDYLKNAGINRFISRLGNGSDYAGNWKNDVFYYNRGINMYPRRIIDTTISFDNLIKVDNNRWVDNRIENYFYIDVKFDCKNDDKFGVEVFTQKDDSGYVMCIEGKNARLYVKRNGLLEVVAERVIEQKAQGNQIVAVADKSAPDDTTTILKFYVNRIAVAEVDDDTFSNGSYALFSENRNVKDVFTDLAGTNISQPVQIARSILKDERKFIVGFYGYLFDNKFSNNQMQKEPGFDLFDVITTSPTGLLRVKSIIDNENPDKYEIVNLDEFMSYANDYYKNKGNILR